MINVGVNMGISIADLEGLARYLGITPDKITPLLILVLVIYRLIVSINKPMKKIIAELQCAIIEVQRLLKDRLEVNFDYKISPFIQSKSPIVLKPEYKHFIIKSGIGKQIKKLKNILILITTRNMFMNKAELRRMRWEF